MPVKSPVTATMKMDPTPMAATWWRSSSRRNGGRNAHARVSPAKSSWPPKSSKTARMRPTPSPPAVVGPSSVAAD